MNGKISVSSEDSSVKSTTTKRFAVVLSKKLSIGEAANVAAIVAGGLKCDGFSKPVRDLDGFPHAGMMWNMPVLRAKTPSQLSKLVTQAAEVHVDAVVFTEQGRTLSNSYATYRNMVESNQISELTIIGVALFGDDPTVRRLTRSFSLLS